MTVLLIDLSGNRRQVEIRDGLDMVLWPIPQRFEVSLQVGAPVFTRPFIATFRRSSEPSWPPVYRQMPVEVP